MFFAVLEYDFDFGNFIVIDINLKYIQKLGEEEELDYVFYFLIYNVIQDDIGLYFCIVCNSYGRDYRSVFFSLNIIVVLGWLIIIYCIFIYELYINYFLKNDNDQSWIVYR